MHLKILFHILLVICFLGSSCQWVQPVGTIPQKTKRHQTETERLAKQIHEKKVYRGPIHISINPSWFHNTELPVKDLTAAFQTQSQSSQPMLEESFVLSQADQMIELPISIADTNLRYYLEIQLESKEMTVKGNLNGSVLKHESKSPTQKYYDGLLLQTKNQLQLSIQGKQSQVVTVKLFESQSKTTLLSQEKPSSSSVTTNQEREQNNEVNVFDPQNIPSLGDLRPYQGDLLLKDPDVPNFVQQVSGVNINGTAPIRFESGTLIVQFNNPELGQALFQNYYGAELVQEIDGFNKFTLDLNKAPILDLPELVRYFNDHTTENIENLSFSSLQSLQTLSVLFDVLKRFPEEIRSIDLNVQGDAPIEFTDIGFSDNNNWQNFTQGSKQL